MVPDSSGSMLDPAEDEIETDDQETQTSNVPSVDVKNYKITTNGFKLFNFWTIRFTKIEPINPPINGPAPKIAKSVESNPNNFTINGIHIENPLNVPKHKLKAISTAMYLRFLKRVIT